MRVRKRERGEGERKKRRKKKRNCLFLSATTTRTDGRSAPFSICEMAFELRNRLDSANPLHAIDVRCQETRNWRLEVDDPGAERQASMRDIDFFSSRSKRASLQLRLPPFVVIDSHLPASAPPICTRQMCIVN